jgi:hypothetical protein
MIERIKNLLTPYYINDLKRYGGNSDGGYILSESLLNNSNIIYSYGVGPEEHYINFDKHMSFLNKKVYLYDASINGLWGNDPNFIFKKEYVNSKNILTHISENGHLSETEMILKMDIEGNEFDTIINSESTLFKYFNQITIEVHDILNSHDEANLVINNDNEEKRWLNKINLFEKLNTYYKLVHIHGNNYSRAKTNGICDVVELTYIRNDTFNNDLEISKLQCPIPDLDFPNNPYDNDVQMNWWIK